MNEQAYVQSLVESLQRDDLIRQGRQGRQTMTTMIAIDRRTQ
jgi:hypothetical protein